MSHIFGKSKVFMVKLENAEVHKKMKHAFKTVNQCGVTALYCFSCVMYGRHTSQFSCLKWLFLSLNVCVLYH